MVALALSGILTGLAGFIFAAARAKNARDKGSKKTFSPRIILDGGKMFLV